MMGEVGLLATLWRPSRPWWMTITSSPRSTKPNSVSSVFSASKTPIEHTEARIVDPATLETLPPGQVGEIWMKGFHVMQGY